MIAHVAWRVEFRRYNSSPSWDREVIHIVAPDGDLQTLLRVLRQEHSSATIEKAERLGPSLVAVAA